MGRKKHIQLDKKAPLDSTIGYFALCTRKAAAAAAKVEH